MSESLNVMGLDVYFGRGVGFAGIRSALASVFEIYYDAIICYEYGRALGVSRFSRPALMHEVGVDSIFAFKADVGMNIDFDWPCALKGILSDLGILVACPDGNSHGGDMLCCA